MPIRPWVQTPRDKSLSDQTNDFLVWVMKALSEIQGAPTPPPAPTVSTSVSGNAVTLTWNEIQGSAGYIVYENTTAVLPPKPVAAVQSLGSQAVRSGLQNSYRIIAQPAGTFYYFVQAITANGIAGAVSTVQKAVVSAAGGPPPAGAANANDHFVSWATDADLPNQDVLPFGLVMGEGDGTKPHAIPAGVAGQVLISNGPGVDPAFLDPIVSGATAIGSAPSTNPVFVATWDGTNIRVPVTLNATPAGTEYALVVRPIGGFAVTVSSGTVTANQGNTGSNAQSWWVRVGDAANGPVAVKPSTTAALATDPSFVVAFSPNSPLPSGGNLIGAVSGDQADNSPNTSAKLAVLPARANAAAPSWTEGNKVPLSTDLAGNLRVTPSTGSSVASATRTDTFTVAGNGVTIDVSANPLKVFSLQVVGTGGAATTWDVRLEGSLDNVNFSQILQHTNGTGNGNVQFSGAALAASRFFRSRVAGLVLGAASNIVVSILGTN